MKVSKIVSIIIFILIVSIFFIVNISSYINKKNSKLEVITTTTTKVKKEEDLLSGEMLDKITIEGEVEDIVVKQYTSHLGYSFKYEPDKFNPIFLSNSNVLINYILDSSMYIQIEKLSEEEYNYQFETLNEFEQIVDDKYLETYSFIKFKNRFLKVTKRVINTSEYMEGVNTRMSYILNTLEIS